MSEISDMLSIGKAGAGLSFISPIIGATISLFFLLFFFSQYINTLNILRITRMLKTWKPNLNFMIPNFRGMLGKTKEQKKVVRYFGKISVIDIILGLCTYGIWFIYVFFFRKMSNSAFDALLNSKADEIASNIEERALDAHGMDADEVKEIPPILAEDYYPGSRYFKPFKDHTFRASEYQMTYLMFSDKQVYAYSYIFDLTSAETTEQTKEYFYEDITTMDITKKQTEMPTFRLSKEWFWGGLALLLVGGGIFLTTLFNNFIHVIEPAVEAEFGYSQSSATAPASSPVMYKQDMGKDVFSRILVIAGTIGVAISIFKGFSRRIVDSLILRLTVANDEFVCAMKPENIAAIQGMKSKIREKKV